MTMRIENSEGNEILTLEDWAKLYDNPKQKRHWKEHRSAHSVADFIINRNGADCLQSRIASVLGQPVSLEHAVPEYELRFDKYGRGRVHDLGIFGQTISGESLFVGVEAKVDESFGSSVRDAYSKATSKKTSGEATKALERIEELLLLHGLETDASMCDIRYQLLYATAGTLAANADISILYVIVFKTPLFDKSIGAENYRDYQKFLTTVGAKSLEGEDNGALVHELILGEKRLVCIHEYFEL